MRNNILALVLFGIGCAAEQKDDLMQVGGGWNSSGGLTTSLKLGTYPWLDSSLGVSGDLSLYGNDEIGQHAFSLALTARRRPVYAGVGPSLTFTDGDSVGGVLAFLGASWRCIFVEGRYTYARSSPPAWYRVKDGQVLDEPVPNRVRDELFHVLGGLQKEF